MRARKKWLLWLPKAQTLIFRGLYGNQNEKKVVTEWLLWLPKGEKMKKITILFNALKDVISVIIKYKDADWTSDNDWNKFIKDIESIRPKYMELGQREDKLIKSLILAVYEYMDETFKG